MHSVTSARPRYHPPVRITIQRGQVGITIDAPASASIQRSDDTEDASRALLDRLEQVMRAAGVHVLRQLPARLLAYGPDVPQLADRARVWLERAGCEVVVSDW